MDETLPQDVIAYVDNWIASIRQTPDDSEPSFQKLLFEAQARISLSDYAEGIRLLVEAHGAVQAFKGEFQWQGVYCTIGCLLASSFDYVGNVDKAEEVYNELINSGLVGTYIVDYAVFLHRRKRDYEKAHTFYLKAIDAYPDSSFIHLKFAAFLRHVKKDAKAAEKHYSLACAKNPSNSEALGSYASFLHSSNISVEGAEQYYEKAIKADPTHVNNLCNMGLFLSEERHDYQRAEELYKRALSVNSKHANTLYNLAVMLDTRCKRKPEAEDFYRRCVEIEPKHAYALYNLAVLLEEKQNEAEAKIAARHAEIDEAEDEPKSSDKKLFLLQREEAQTFYKRATDADPNDPTTLADYGRYLLAKMDNPTAAEPILLAALKLDAHSEIAMYNLGILHYRFKQDLYVAVTYLRTLISKHPRHLAGTHQLARAWIELHKKKIEGGGGTKRVPLEFAEAVPMDEAMNAYERAISISKESSKVANEYLKVVTKYGSTKQKLRCIASLDAIAPNIANGLKDASLDSGSQQQPSQAVKALENLRLTMRATTQQTTQASAT